MAAPDDGLWRVTDRASFAALRHGRRGRSGGVSVSYLPAAGEATAPRVAFRVGRSVGGAVTRNRIRRRLRAALASLRRQGELPEGTYLVGGTPALATQPWPALLTDVRTAVARATGPVVPGRGGA